MTMEHRVRSALGGLDSVEPSNDLWVRVTRSIEEDLVRRRRMRFILAATAFAVVAVVVLGIMFRVQTSIGRLAIEWRAMEGIETLVLALLILVLGPAVRRFGEGYAEAVFRANPTTGTGFARLLDVSYYLVFTGYLLVSTEFERPSEALFGLGNQMEAAAGRVGGLLLFMGVLHGLTILIMPLLGVVFTAVWHKRRLPRSINIVLVVVGILGGLWVLQLVAGLIFGGL